MNLTISVEKVDGENVLVINDSNTTIRIRVTKENTNYAAEELLNGVVGLARGGSCNKRNWFKDLTESYTERDSMWRD